MKFLKTIFLVGAVVASSSALGSMITNGDFASSCNLDGWETYGEVSLTGTPANCAAQMDVNYDDFFADLYQGLMLESGFEYLLTVDFDTSLLSIEDSFYISLISQNNDLYDFLAPEDINFDGQSKSFVINTDDLIDNYSTDSWSLYFSLQDGFEEASDSTVLINSVSLNKIVSEVPEPTSIALFAMGFAGLMTRRRFPSDVTVTSLAK
ncbi:PEP-CTERM sorting domain-containing protein [Alteromonadaceae bacterium BrNp21-10]|nr:PEP-CTERM sorting domain-containing protein [Alteromonadaceae bacterium BrNp21-10]